MRYAHAIIIVGNVHPRGDWTTRGRAPRHAMTHNAARQPRRRIDDPVEIDAVNNDPSNVRQNVSLSVEAIPADICPGEGCVRCVAVTS